MPTQSNAPTLPLTATDANADPLLTEREAADFLRCAVQTLRNYRWRGLPPRWHKIGTRMVRYKRSDLEAFIEGSDNDTGAPA